MSEYSKEVLNLEEQIELLKSRKLIFDDLDKAKKYLTHI
jgi:abortive infection bacteriophage resistance protein